MTSSLCFLLNAPSWANVTQDNDCELDNTAYIGYSTNGEFIDIVSRYAQSSDNSFHAFSLVLVH